MTEKGMKRLTLLTEGDRSQADRALEELRIHQAELEAQNLELTQMRDRLELERGRYLALFQALPIPGVVLDRMAVIVEANAAAVGFFGFSSKRALHRHSFRRLLADRGGAWFGDALAQASRDGSWEVEGAVQLMDRAGQSIPVDLRLIRMSNEYHLDEHMLVLAIDRRRQEVHDRHRRLYQALLDNSPALVTAYDRHGRCLLMNQRASEVLAVSAQSAIGQPRSAFLPGEQLDYERQSDQRVWESGHPIQESLRWPTEDGRLYAVNRFPLRDAERRIFAVATISADITEMESMRQRLDLAMQVFSRGAEGVIITDEKRRITFVNEAFKNMLGVPDIEIQGHEPDFLSTSHHPPGFARDIFRGLLARGGWEGEVWVRRRNGEVFPAWLRLSVVRALNGRVSHFIGIVNDITQRKAAEEEIQRLAYFDSLTGLPNRYLLKDRVDQAIRRCHRGGKGFALVFLDLDRFKEINDAFGHGMGDGLLVEFARRLRRLLREQDTVCRLGGDEFVLVLMEISAESLLQRVRSVLESATRPFEIKGHRLQVSASIGIAMYPDDGESFDELLKNADTAMYQSKSAGRNTFRFFDPQMALEASRRAVVENALREALHSDQIHMVFQPQVALDSNRLIGAEALMRWRHPELGEIPPAEFIQLAERTGLIVELGNRALDMVLAQLAAWRSTRLADLPVSVNVSGEQFWRKDFLDRIRAGLADADLPPRSLALELTEHTAMRLPDEAVRIMDSLSQLGVSLAIDDFGTGYSSLAYLHRFPLDVIKIDRSFVCELETSETARQVCRSILTIAQTTGLKTIAEGVETEGQRDFLARLGCGAMQGFLFARPMGAEEFLAFAEKYA